MERLTKYNNGRYVIESGVRMLYEALTKLGKYEDIGVSPEQLHEFSSIYLEKCEEVNRLSAELANIEMVGFFVRKKCHHNRKKTLHLIIDRWNCI